ncbi:chain length determinant protein tyrosine kinase EpsG [Dechloromonas denitrificans]|uniref:non-specific protein-tyrosine kinase n=1 Tax=Dechloromonas denitrificans TaxID=281362 RepID=A0A133XI00_9RHOO|nr:chain length determinant protein tyrosine kinase EpsG [Dechloromonas denitrificans]KXB30548.1 chain length determinant protein tyrosine kinase EpsG [Dechloromonas denitrificans]
MNAINEKLTSGSGRSIGAILIDNGRLTPEAAERILKLQKEQGLRFGDAAIQLGLLSEADIQQALSRQYDYPYLMPGDERVSEEVIAAFKPFSPVVEQLRALRSQLMLRWFDAEAGHKTLAVVSAGRGEGRSFTAANLAVVFSQLGERTLLIDADLRHPRQHQLFRLENKLGLSSLLAGRAELGEAVTRIPGLIDLSILPAGATPPNPQELLARPVFNALMATVQGQYDIVVVDTPAGAETADNQTIAARTRGAVVVARKDLSLAPQLQTLVSSLQHAGVAVVGAVLNNG